MSKQTHTLERDREGIIEDYFKMPSQESELLKNGKFSRSNLIYIKIPSVSSLHRFMHDHTPNGSTLFSEYAGDESRNGWNGTKTWDEYIELLDKGDERVVKLIKAETTKAVNELEHRYEKVITAYKFDVAGEFFDIGLVLSGVPETWLEPKYEENEKPRVVIRVNNSFTNGAESDEIIRNGARIISMAKVLENMNIEVCIEMYTITANWEGYGDSAPVLITSLEAKGFNEPINYNKLSSLLTTSYQRRGSFRLREVLRGSRTSSGIGRSSENIEGIVKMDNTYDIDNLEKELFQNFKG